MRRSSPEKEAQRLADAFAARTRDLTEREKALDAAEKDAEQETRDANLTRGLEEIGESEHAERIAAAEARVAEAKAARDRARDVLTQVGHAAADAAEAVERAKVEAAIADVQRIAQAREEAEAVVVKLAADEALAEERLEIVQRQALDARAGFDQVATAEAERRAEKDRRTVLWHVQERHDPADPSIPPHLRDAYAAEIARRVEEDEAYKERLRARPDRVDADGDANGIPQQSPFPVTRPVG